MSDKLVLNYSTNTLSITQGRFEANPSHGSLNAYDDNLGGTGNDGWLLAPTTMVMRGFLGDEGNNWHAFESVEPVEYVNGDIDYITLILLHTEDLIYNVNDVIPKDTPLYYEGSSGYVTGAHIHMEIVRGKFVDFSSSRGNVNIEDAFYIYKAINIINDYDYNFKYIEDVEVKPVKKKKYKSLITNKKKIYRKRRYFYG